MDFIQLTLSREYEAPIIVNTDIVTTIQEGSHGGAFVSLSGQKGLIVKESVEEVMKLLNGSKG